MDFPTEALPWYSEECVRRISVASQPERDEMIGNLARQYRGRPHGVFMVQCVYVFSRLLELGIEASSKGYAAGVSDCLSELVESNMNYRSWPHGDKIDHIGFALCHLDNTCSRLSYKICRRLAFSALSEIADAKKKAFSAADLLTNRPTAAREVVSAVRYLNEVMWLKYKGGESREIWSTIWNLQLMEECVDRIPLVPYTDGDTDFLNFDHYGIGFDMYCVGTWNVLGRFKEQLSHVQLSETVTRVINMSRDEIIAEIPNPISRPEDWKYSGSLESITQIVQSFFR